MKGFYHIHLRKRKAPSLEPFPARNFWFRLLDRLVLVVGVIGPLVTVPQILKIYVTHDASGISLVSWGMWALLDIPWILYGIAHREPPIVITYTLYCILNSIVVVEAVMLGAGLS